MLYAVVVVMRLRATYKLRERHRISLKICIEIETKLVCKTAMRRVKHALGVRVETVIMVEFQGKFVNMLHMRA